MVKLNWTGQAIDDLLDIGDYIAEDSEQYARHPPLLVLRVSMWGGPPTSTRFQSDV